MLFKIESISLSHIESLSSVIFESFSNHQIDCGHINEEFRDYLLYTSVLNVESMLGYVAINMSNEVIGGVLCCDLKDSLLFENADEDSMMAILKLLNSKYFDNFTIQEGEYLQIKFVGVRGDSAGKGVAKALIHAALENGLSKRFKFAQAESAGLHSQHLFEKMNFVSKAEVNYDEFTFKGTTPFISTTDHQSIKLMIKEL